MYSFRDKMIYWKPLVVWTKKKICAWLLITAFQPSLIWLNTPSLIQNCLIVKNRLVYFIPDTAGALKNDYTQRNWNLFSCQEYNEVKRCYVPVINLHLLLLNTQPVSRKMPFDNNKYYHGSFQRRLIRFAPFPDNEWNCRCFLFCWEHTHRYTACRRML